MVKEYISKIFLIFLISSCADLPWKKYPMKVRPDFSCYTGSESGSIAYVWECYEGKRVVVYQNQAGLYRWPAKKIVSQCGRVTEIEKERKFYPSPEGACWKKPMPYKSQDRIVSDKVVLKNENEVDECEFLGNYQWHGDTAKDAEKAIVEVMRKDYANVYTSLEHETETNWLETIHYASAKAYNCKNYR